MPSDETYDLEPLMFGGRAIRAAAEVAKPIDGLDSEDRDCAVRLLRSRASRIGCLDRGRSHGTIDRDGKMNCVAQREARGGRPTGKELGVSGGA